MLSFWESFAINLFSTLIRAIVKNPAKYASLRNQLDQIAQDILTAFPPDVPSTPGN